MAKGGARHPRHRRTTSVQFASLLVLVATWGHTSQERGRLPPPVTMAAGQFTAVQVDREPAIDGKEWIAADVRTPFLDHVVNPTRSFSLTFTDCGDHDGDFERCQLLFRGGGGRPVRIDNGYTGWVYVTPDRRYIFTEPLYALDVRAWKQYAVFDALHIPNYVSIRAISRDGRRLFISRTDCPMDCRGEQRWQSYELTLPK
jgi:hypothetical protein